MSILKWKELIFPSGQLLNIEKTVFSYKRINIAIYRGQCFNWRQNKDGGVIGVLKSNVIAIKAENNKSCQYCCLNNESLDLNSYLIKYFSLNVNINEEYKNWLKNLKMKTNISLDELDLRIMNQNLHECLFSYICSSNNNIKRITQLITSLRENYGKYIITFNDIKYYEFPNLEELYKIKEEDYNKMGFGYRSKYFLNSLKYIKEHGGSEYYNNILNIKDDKSKVKELLLVLNGVGNKVADCVMLYSLGYYNIVPIDTHMYQIAKRDYGYKSVNKSLTSSNYDEVQDLYEKLFGKYAGWAQILLFQNEISSSSSSSSSTTTTTTKAIKRKRNNS